MTYLDFDAILAKIKEISEIDSVAIEAVLATETSCPDCGYDPVNKEAANPTCAACGGRGKVIGENLVTLNASVEFVSGMDSVHTLAGKFEKGTVVATIHVSELERTGIDIGSVKHFVIYGKRYKPCEITPQYLGGVCYEFVIELERGKAT